MTLAEPGPKQPLPDWYMQRDMVEVFSRIMAGEFCEIVGVGSAGKSNFARHMTRSDVKRRYMHQFEPYYIMVLLNPHLMVTADSSVSDAWPGYEIMLSRLRRELIDLERRNLITTTPESGDVIAQVERRYANLFSTHTVIAQSGIRHMEDAVYEVLALGKDWQVVFIFDEMEEFMRNLPPEFFQSLRGIRDEFKGRVMYVTTSRVPLVQIPLPETDGHDAMVLQGFLELFHGFTYHLRPLDEQSALEVIRRLEQRNAYAMPDSNQRRLLEATGGHAGLLRRGFLPTMTLSNSRRSDSAYFNALLSDRGVRQECEMIYDSLSEDEQEAIMAITRDHPPDEESPALQSLIDKNLIVKRNNNYYHAIPLFAGFLRERA